MAAYRSNIPLRQTAEMCLIEDGTMCRMPSPRPGPLRGETSDRLSEAGMSVDTRRSSANDPADIIKISALPMAARMAA